MIDDRTAGAPPQARTARNARIACGLLLLLAAVALPLIIAIGSDKAPEPPVAGRYTVENGEGCLGGTFDLRQSGTFISLTHPDGEAFGRLRIEDGEITGTLPCVAGGPDGTIRARATGNTIEGMVGIAPVEAVRTRDFDAVAGSDPTNPSNVDGTYLLSPQSVCLGREITLAGGERPRLSLDNGNEATLIYADGELHGSITCLDGDEANLLGVATGDRLELEARRLDPTEGEQTIEQAVGEPEVPLGDRAASFFLAVVAVVAATSLAGIVAVRLGQPRVMGEIVAGILLGPTLLGEIAPDLQAELFSASTLDVLGVVANFGLIVYMFIIGVELETGALRGRGSQVLIIGAASFVVPLLLGALTALVIFDFVAPDTDFAPFALFLGISMAITAFPVLARILEERHMLGGVLGTTALAAAAFDDLLGWLLITVATALAAAGTGSEALGTLFWVLVFGAIMYGLVRPLLRRAAAAYDRSGGAGWIAVVFAGILISAYATEEIGVALIIGALIMGTAMPKRAALTDDVRRGSETFVTLLLLPLFFAYTGLRTDVGLLGPFELWVLAAALLAVAIVGKLVTATIAARFAGFGWRSSAVVGTLMNTRGLTELIVLNLALEAGVISEALFTALVLMALVTTFMAGPLLRLLDPDRRGPRPEVAVR